VNACKADVRHVDPIDCNRGQPRVTTMWENAVLEQTRKSGSWS